VKLRNEQVAEMFEKKKKGKAPNYFFQQEKKKEGRGNLERKASRRNRTNDRAPSCFAFGGERGGKKGGGAVHIAGPKKKKKKGRRPCAKPRNGHKKTFSGRSPMDVAAKRGGRRKGRLQPANLKKKKGRKEGGNG